MDYLERIRRAASALAIEAGHPEDPESRPTIVVDRDAYARLWHALHWVTPPGRCGRCGSTNRRRDESGLDDQCMSCGDRVAVTS